MKKVKTDKTLSQSSKISDFFSKIPNKVGDNKRKLCVISQNSENCIPSSIKEVSTNSSKVSPNLKKIKHDEKFFDASTSLKTEIIDLATNFKVETPKKVIKPSSSMKTPTPKKSGGSSDKTKTPQSVKKGTPKKLFEKSPGSVKKFNVQLLETFVNISPSTSNKKVTVKTPTKLPYFQNESNRSPAAITSRNRLSTSQNRNETTPSKSPKSAILTLTPKAKTRLSFLESIDMSFKKETNSDSDLNNENNLDIDNFLDDQFHMISFDEIHTLDLSEPQYCTITGINNSNSDVELKLRSINEKSLGSCTIQEFWASGLNFSKGDTVFINAKKIKNKWIVNNSYGWLVYEPNILVSCTSVVGSAFCKRKIILSDRFKGFDSANKVLVVGTLTHTLLQQALKNKLNTFDQIQTLLKSILASKDTMKRLYESNLTYLEIESELQTFVPKLETFINDHINKKCLSNDYSSDNWQGCILDIEDIEENVWCPELGIKGKVDVTLKTGTGIMPLELKTGRATMSLEHRGQVVLYIMMMNKFGYKVSSGLLLYLREGTLKEIKATPHEKRDIMIMRNELAYYLTRRAEFVNQDFLTPPQLPEPLHNQRACSKCPYNTLCTSYLKFESHNISGNKGIQGVQESALSHLSESHLEYFLRWTNFLSLEEECNHISKSVKRIYTVPPEKRESSGRCITNVKVTFTGEEINGLFEHTFSKENKSLSLTTYEITENNYIVVSTNRRPAVATGFVTEITPEKISILLDRDLNKKYSGQYFHLDTYDSNITFTFNMTSLALLLEKTQRGAELREIIIDRKPPTFLAKLPSVVAKKGAGILKRLNIVQQRAVLRALCAKEFFLIKGMPGCGKSATIVALIQLLIELGKSVLITSHTHSAVDNICMRLQNREVDFLRLGSEARIHPNVKPNSEAALTEHCSTPEELEQVYNKYNVIAVTCLGSGHPLLTKRVIDVCIVDESTQVLQTSILKPLYAAKTFILIGDPEQLTPLVKNQNATVGGMSESLFERLSTPEGTIVLNLNYRMNETLTNLANILTYEGELKPANEEVANRTLDIPNKEAILHSFANHPWLLEAMDTSLKSAAQLIDTGPVWNQPDVKWDFKSSKFKENGDNQNCLNSYEAAIISTLVRALLQGGVPNNEIGVIATYRAQMAHISDLLENYSVDVSTIDQFQGRDKSIIIFSCTKSMDPLKSYVESSKNELLQDSRRLTVAITRAKRKLLIVGDVSTLEKFKPFAKILPEMKKHLIKFESSWRLLNDFVSQ